MIPETGGRIRCYGYALFALSRPAFLIGTTPLYLVGLAAAMEAGRRPAVGPAVLGLALVWTIQAMTHYANEYRDVEVDAAAGRESRVAGGSGALVDLAVPRRLARYAALGCLAASVPLGAALAAIVDGGAVVLSIAAIAAALGWWYSTPPVALASRGAGEATAAVVTGLLVPAMGYAIGTATVTAELAWTALPLVALAFASALSTAVPDVEGDRAGGKLTLVARLGRRRGVALAAASLLVGAVALAVRLESVRSGAGPLSFASLVPILAGYARYAPAAARGSIPAADRAALAAIACLGWASIVATVVLLVG